MYTKKNDNEAIMILDDRKDILNNTKAYLDSYNKKVFLCSNIKEAEEILLKNYYQIKTAFIDLKLKHESGSVFIGNNISKYPEIKFIVFTAWNIEEKEKIFFIKNNITMLDKQVFNPKFFLDPNLIEDNSNYFEKSKKIIKQ